MNMKLKQYTIGVLLIPVLLYSCKKEGRVDHIDSSAPAPAQISEVDATATPGGAVLTYKVPKDPNFSYAKAEYEIQPGVIREAKASLYTDTLKLVGFGDTLSHTVSIYSVGKNEKASEPIQVTVKPLEPPVRSVFKTVNIIPAFGGVQVSFENPSSADLAIEVMVDTTGLKTWNTLDAFHTGAVAGSFSVRGLDSVPQTFAVFVRDRWNNKSDTLITSLKPIFEQEIPKDTWKPLVLPNDEKTTASSSFDLVNAWDGCIATLGSKCSYASGNESKLPQWFTIDLGKEVVISRIVEHQAPTSHLYVGSGVKTFEIWGSNNPAPDGSWESWDSLGTFHSFKPSGLPLGQTSAEDKEYGWDQGEDFEFDHILPAYRFIRWKTLETYSSSGQVVICEIDLYGQLQP